MEESKCKTQCKGCKKCVVCDNFHKIEGIITENNISTMIVSNEKELRNGDKFCFVITCKAKLPDENTTFTIQIGGDSYGLTGKNNKFKKRKLYKARILNNQINLLY